MSTASAILNVILLIGATLRSSEARGPLVWQDDFNTLNTASWKHLITGWRGGNNEFQYYTDRAENRYDCSLFTCKCFKEKWLTAMYFQLCSGRNSVHPTDVNCGSIFRGFPVQRGIELEPRGM